jgi:hypothetical protein
MHIVSLLVYEHIIGNRANEPHKLGGTGILE